MNNKKDLNWSNEAILDDLKNQKNEKSATDKIDIILQNGLTANATNGNVHQYHTNEAEANGLSNSGFGLASSSGTYILDPYEPKQVVDVKVTVETIEITYVQRSKFTYTTTINVSIGTRYQTANNDRVFKEIYGCSDGKLTLLKTIQGHINPPILEESYYFDDEE